MAADFWSWAQAEINKVARQKGISTQAAAKLVQNNLNYAAKGAASGKQAAKGTYAADRAKKYVGPVRDAIQKPAPKPSRPTSTRNAAAKSMIARADGYAKSQSSKSAAKYKAAPPVRDSFQRVKPKPTRYR